MKIHLNQLLSDRPELSSQSRGAEFIWVSVQILKERGKLSKSMENRLYYVITFLYRALGACGAKFECSKPDYALSSTALDVYGWSQLLKVRVVEWRWVRCLSSRVLL